MSLNRKLFSSGICTFLIILAIWSQPVQAQTADFTKEYLTDQKVEKIIFCTDVVNREPVGEIQQLSAQTSRLFCYTVIRNDSAATTIKHLWLLNGQLISEVELPIGTSPAWRTWSSKQIPPDHKGPWQVLIRDAKGNELSKKILPSETVTKADKENDD